MMKYELTAIDRHDAGETELLIKDNVLVRLALISWDVNGFTRLYLNPANATTLEKRTADAVDIVPSVTVPIFDAVELATVRATINDHAAKIRGQRRKTFRYVDADARRIASTAALLSKTIITPGNKTAEGVLVQAVTSTWFEIVDLLKRDPALAFRIDPRKWEEILAGIYERSGFDEVTLTPRSGDLGRDVIAVKRGVGSVRVIDQMKAYKPGHLVTANDVRALMGIVGPDGASKGFVTTTSDFAPGIWTDPLIQKVMPGSLELINGTQLLARLGELARGHRP